MDVHLSVRLGLYKRYIFKKMFYCLYGYDCSKRNENAPLRNEYKAAPKSICYTSSKDQSSRVQRFQNLLYLVASQSPPYIWQLSYRDTTSFYSDCTKYVWDTHYKNGYDFPWSPLESLIVWWFFVTWRKKPIYWKFAKLEWSDMNPSRS